MKFDHYNIEKYIQGELSGNELVEFETSLEKDKNLRGKVHFYQYAMSILSKNKVTTKADADKIAEIKPILDEMRNKYFINKTTQTEILKEDTKPKPTLIKRLFPFAALAAAAALLIVLFLPNLQNQSNPEIADRNFQPYSLNTNSMGGEDLDILFKDAQKNYNNGRYDEANEQFTAFLNENLKAPDVWLAKGCSEFKLNDISSAINSFEKVIEIDDSGISHPYANWYLALCYLKKDESENTIDYLNKIKEGADNYAAAKRLLRQIE